MGRRSELWQECLEPMRPRDVEALAAHWRGSELIWLEGGHASFHLMGKPAQATIIARAFERFDRLTRA